MITYLKSMLYSIGTILIGAIIITILNYFNVNSIAKVKVNLFDDRQVLLNYLKSFFHISSYCVGAVCNGEICYYINDENITDFAKARLYDCINYS